MSGLNPDGLGNTERFSNAEGESLGIERLLTASRPADAVVWSDGSTVYADGVAAVDSGADPTTVLQAALDAVKADGGGGVYLHSSAVPDAHVTVPSGVKLLGNGRMNKAGSTVWGSRIVGSNGSGPLVTVKRCGEIRGVAIKNTASGGRAVDIEGYAIMEDCQLRAENGAVVDSANSDSAEAKIRYNSIISNTGDGSGTIGLDLRISDCKVENNIIKGHEIAVYSQNGNNRYRENHVYGAENGSGVKYCLALTAGNSTVEDNYLANATTACIRVTDKEGDGYGNAHQITDNKLEFDEGAYGVFFDYSSPTVLIQTDCSHNYAKGTNTGRAIHGPNVDYAGNGSQIIDNVSVGCDLGIRTRISDRHNFSAGASSSTVTLPSDFVGSLSQDDSLSLEPVYQWATSAASKYQIDATTISNDSFDILLDTDPTQQVTFNYTVETTNNH